MFGVDNFRGGSRIYFLINKYVKLIKLSVAEIKTCILLMNEYNLALLQKD